MAYQSWSVVFGEQPSAAKWNILGTNDDHFYGFLGDNETWQSWSPTLTNVTIGNGTVTAKYIQIGKTIFFHLMISAGSTTSSSNTPRFSLPTGANSVTYYIESAGSSNNALINATGWLLNASTSAFPVFSRLYGADVLELTIGITNSTYLSSTGIDMDASAVPFQFGNGDKIYVDGFYEAA